MLSLDPTIHCLPGTAAAAVGDTCRDNLDHLQPNHTALDCLWYIVQLDFLQCKYIHSYVVIVISCWWLWCLAVLEAVVLGPPLLLRKPCISGGVQSARNAFMEVYFTCSCTGTGTRVMN